MSEYTHRDVDDLLTNPVWDDIEAELKARQEVLFSKLLKQDTPEAIEYKLIMKFLALPRDMREELKETKNARP